MHSLREYLKWFDTPVPLRFGLGSAATLAVILGAFVFQAIGIEPCELCYVQRWPYYLALPVMALVLIFWKKLPHRLRLGLTALLMLTFIVSMFLGGYHAGVEYGFWPGPTSCTTAGGGLSFDDLNKINDTSIVFCDEVQFEIFGISLAGFNVLSSIFIAAVMGWSMIGQIRRAKAA